MPLNLNQPLRLTGLPAPQQAALRNLQGNILKGHGREHTVNVFLQFAAADAPAVRAYLAAIPVTDAWTQLTDAAAVRAARRKGKKEPKTAPFVALALSHQAYGKLGVAASRTPSHDSFVKGMKNRAVALQDPPAAQWEAGFRGDLDVLLLVGDTSPAKAKAAAQKLLSGKPSTLREVAREIGVAYRNANRDGLEHFGYVDGRSQPLLIDEDVDRERDESTGIDQWDPKFPLSAALLPEPGGGADDFGSYFVFRKLEQNVKGFLAEEVKLAAKLALPAAKADLAGAMAVGRFRDGTPVALQHGPGMHHPVSNNFGYGADPDGRKCPLHAHIRKTNPRGDTTRLGATVEAERTHLMPRRGITYGKRKLGKDGFAPKDRPSKGVGLLFMAYNQDLGRQFEFTQQSWADNAGFVAPGTGIDPVIGQGAGASTPQSWPKAWGGAARQPSAFHGFVKMLGGEYFFAPSLTFLKNL